MCGALREEVVSLGAKLSNIEQIYWRKAKNSKKNHLTPIYKKIYIYQQIVLYQNIKKYTPKYPLRHLPPPFLPYTKFKGESQNPLLLQKIQKLV